MTGDETALRMERAALKAAVDWFNGLPVEPVRYQPKHVITKKDVEEYMSAQRQTEIMNGLFTCRWPLEGQFLHSGIGRNT